MLRIRAQGRKVRDAIGEGERGPKKRKIPQRSCSRAVGNRGNLGGNRNKRRQESVDSKSAGQGNLENSKEAGKEAQGTRGLRKNYKESVPPLSRLIRVFVIISIINSPLWGPVQVA